jgi:hypothetical protein
MNRLFYPPYVPRGTVINKITLEKIKTVPLFGITATLVSWALRKGYKKECFFSAFLRDSYMCLK